MNLFWRYKYKVFLTGVDVSHQNGPVEHGHQTIAISVRALLFGSGLSVKFWPYDFFHVLCSRNALPHRDKISSPLYLITGKKDIFKNLYTFSLPVFVWPPGFWKKCFKEDARQGIFLGHVPHTNYLILYYDKGTNQVKITTHSKFYEGFNDLPVDNFALNCQHILCLNWTQVPPYKTKLNSSDFEFFVYLFSNKEIAVIPVLSNTTDVSFGFDLKDYELSGQTYVQDVDDTILSSSAKSFGIGKQSWKKLCGAFITHIDGDTIFSTD